MKKIIITAIFAGITCSSFAQFGISAGANYTKYSYSKKSFDIERKSMLAYNIGLQYQLPLTENSFLLPELGYTVKGARVYYSYPIGFTGPMKSTNHINYIQMTLPFVYSTEIGDDLDLEFGAGIYTAFLINAKAKIEEFDGSTTTKKFNDDAFKKLDYGTHFLLGFKYGKHLGLHFKYDLGLANIEKNKNNPTVKNRNLSLNISWLFSNKKSAKD